MLNSGHDNINWDFIQPIQTGKLRVTLRKIWREDIIAILPNSLSYAL